MDKIAALWFCIGALSCAFIFQGELIQLSDALYAIPPTEAFKVLELNDTINTQGEEVNATNHIDRLHIITDGSIEINRGVDGTP